MTILLIDDELYVLQRLIGELSLSGHSVTTCESVSVFASILRNPALKFDGVILDVMMPVGDLDVDAADWGMATGVVLFPKIRGRWPDVPIVLLTNRSGLDLTLIAPNDKKVRILQKDQSTFLDLIEAIKLRPSSHDVNEL